MDASDTPAKAADPSLGHLARQLARRVLDLALPPHCGLCGTEVDAPATLCAACWAQVSFVSDPVCGHCGCPLELDFGDTPVCLDCAEHPPAFERARACVLYDDAARSLILRLKHGDRHDLAQLFGAWAARAGTPFWADADAIVPVPLHWTRLWSRRFNQSALIAADVARRTGVRVLPDAVRRVRRTPSQGGLKRKQRFRNVRRAFSVRPRAIPAVRGKHIVLIDDVMTTGATVSAVADALYGAGAARVDAVTVARVDRPPQGR